MLIRTQDRKALVDITGKIIRIEKYCKQTDSREMEVYYTIETSNYCYSLAKYSSNEKAMKVLNMIQDDLVLPIYKNIVGENETVIYTNKVFQMPEDSEVDV